MIFELSFGESMISETSSVNFSTRQHPKDNADF